MLRGALQKRLRAGFHGEGASFCGLDRATAVMPWMKSKTLSGGRPSSARTVSTILAVSAFEKPRLRTKSVRSSSVHATMRSRAVRVPWTKGEDADEERLLALAPTRATNAPRLAASRRITYRAALVPSKTLGFAHSKIESGST